MTSDETGFCAVHRCGMPCKWCAMATTDRPQDQPAAPTWNPTAFDCEFLKAMKIAPEASGYVGQ